MEMNADGSFDINLLNVLWQTLSVNSVFASRFPNYLKLVEMAIIIFMGNVEDERTFNTVKFLKSNLRNSLLKNHLALVVGMRQQKIFTIQSFPYNTTFSEWYNTLDRTWYGASA